MVTHAILHANLHFLNKLLKWEISSDFHLVALISFPSAPRKWKPLWVWNNLLSSSCFMVFPSILSLLVLFQSLSFLSYFLNIAEEAGNTKGFFMCDPSVPCKLSSLQWKRVLSHKKCWFGFSDFRCLSTMVSSLNLRSCSLRDDSSCLSSVTYFSVQAS